MEIAPVILAGGSGSRLWPLSREHYPKQLLPLHGEETLLQQTARRLDGLEESGEPGALRVLPPLVVCNEEHRFLIAEQLRAVERDAGRILLEPVARNTAPALTLAALTAVSEEGRDPVLLVMPADHVIADPVAFQAAARDAAHLAVDGVVVTFGVVPDRPETGYGYIQQGEPLEAEGLQQTVYALRAFVEKPDAERARHYLDSGRYLWNSGMFVVRASVWLEAIGHFQPDMAYACQAAYEHGRADEDFYRVDREAFEASPSDSIDYAVMERQGEVGDDAHRLTAAVIPLRAGWSDVGAWSALWEINPSDAQGNVVEGDVFYHDTRQSLLVAEHRLVAVVGMEGVVVIETPDAVLVTDRDHAQDVKQVVAWLQAQGRDESKIHRRVYRPWGSYEGLEAGARYQVKRLTLVPGAAISLQMHHHRAEHWVVVQGTARVTRGDEEFLLSENQSTFIPLGITHRLENPGKVDLEIIEVQSGSYLGEDDIVRFEDRYDRATQA